MDIGITQFASFIPGIALLGVFGAVLFFIFLIWSVFWKGIALWIAAKENQKIWFIVLLVINTVGILEIIYVFFFSKWGKNWREDRFGKEKEETLFKDEEVSG